MRKNRGQQSFSVHFIGYKGEKQEDWKVHEQLLTPNQAQMHHVFAQTSRNIHTYVAGTRTYKVCQ